MQRYFVKAPLRLNSESQLTKEDSHHLIKVMRATIGEKIEVVDPDGHVFIANLTNVQNIAEFMTTEEVTKQVELPIEVTIACGISKGDKNEQIVKRATELGAQHFLFFESRYSVAKWPAAKVAKKVKRLNEIAKGAAEQSHRQRIPSVNFITEHQLLETDIGNRMVAYEESAKQGEGSNFKSLISKLETDQQLIAVFGPEGGLSEDEIDQFTKKNFVLAGLGPRILRAETAPMYVMSALSYQFELK